MQGKGKYLELACLSDIHLGHSLVSTNDIISRLYKALPSNSETDKLDAIFLAGDVFDKLLFLPDAPVLEIQIWIADLFELCHRHDIVLRVLEGTPSHDRGQGRQFEMIYLTVGYDKEDKFVDFKYVDTLSIEYITSLDIHALYVPDEWDHDPDITWGSVKGLLEEQGLDKVDFAIMHGNFEYHLPEHLKIPSHQSARYLDIVKHYIFIGHFHTHSVYDRIITQGSFDRLGHGEEEAKGHVRVRVSEDGHHDRVEFRINHDATRFVTIDATDMDTAGVINKLKAHDDLPKGSHVRIQCTSDGDVKNAISTLREHFPHYTMKLKVVSDKTTTDSDVTGLTAKYEAVEISSANITALLEEKCIAAGLDANRTEQVKALLKRVQAQ
tara:strand:+ start:107 stop:1252 length:1146 start_codon:yes stop_codon:yes gene_type:complete